MAPRLFHASGRLLVALRGERLGDAVVVDTASGASATHAIATCPAEDGG